MKYFLLLLFSLPVCAQINNPPTRINNATVSGSTTLGGTLTNNGTISGGILSSTAVSGTTGFNGTLNINNNLVMVSGTTVDFTATSGSSGTTTYNGLWRIKEGTWTPQASGTTTSSAPTYTSQSGNWLIINDWVKITGVLAWSAWTATGNIIIVNLPWTPTSANQNACSFRSDGLTLSASNYLQGLVTSGNPGRITLENYPVGGGSGTAVAVDTVVSALQFSCEYKTSL